MQTSPVEVPAPTLFRSTTQFVHVTILARSANGQLVKDLKKEELEILEQGHRQTIATFSSNNDRPAALSQAVSLSPGKFSNRNRASVIDGTNILFLDVADTTWTDWQLAWKQVLPLLRSLHRTDHLAIYSLTTARGFQVLLDDSDDVSVLLHKLDKYQNPTLAILTPLAQPSLDAPSAFASRHDGLEAPQLLSLGRIQNLAGALEVIADHLAGLQGRKSLIWLSSSFSNPFHPSHNPDGSLDLRTDRYRLRMLKTINHLIASDISINPVDARGLIPDFTFDAANADLGMRPIQRESTGTPNSLILHDFSALNELASHSGGKAYYNTNGIADSIKDATVAAQNSYTLGFYTSSTIDNKFHSIKLITHRAGVRLQYRPGYWALSTSINDLDTSRESLKTALESPFTANTIGLTADCALGAKSNGELAVTIHIDPKDLRLRKDHNLWTGTVDYIYGQKDEMGRVFAVPPFRKQVQLSDEQIEREPDHLPLVEIRVSVRQTSKLVRVAVRDASSNAVGSVDIPLSEIPR